MTKELLFSIHKKDFITQVFRAGGPGGQKQNKTSSAVRIIHTPSGARGECRNHRQQSQNKKEAFKRLVSSPKFQVWINKKVFEVTDGETIDQKVDKQMDPKNLKIETKETGIWK